MLEVREIREGDAEALHANMARPDRMEIDALGVGSVADVRDFIEASDKAFAAVDEHGELAGLFGLRVISLIDGKAMPWALRTKVGQREWRAWARGSKRIAAHWMATYPYLTNMVDDRFTDCHRWLEWMGFELGEPVAMGDNGELFRVFEWGFDV